MRYFYLISAILLVGLCSTVVADLTVNYNPTGAGCVDSKGFLSCYQAQIDKAVSCNKACNSTIPDYNSNVYQNCVLGCTGSWLAGNIGCWIQSCWNQVSFLTQKVLPNRNRYIHASTNLRQSAILADLIS
jgi:hypothetical protein